MKKTAMASMVMVIFLVFMAFTTFSAGKKNYVLTYEGKVLQNEYVPFIISSDGEICVQARLIAQQLGWKLEWQNETKSVLINNTEAEFIISDDISYIPMNWLNKEFNIVDDVDESRTRVDLTKYVNYARPCNIPEEDKKTAAERIRAAANPNAKDTYNCALEFYNDYSELINELRDKLFNDWRLDNAGHITIYFGNCKEADWSSEKENYNIRVNKISTVPQNIFATADEQERKEIEDYLKNDEAYNQMFQRMQAAYRNAEYADIEFYSIDGDLKNLIFNYYVKEKDMINSLGVHIEYSTESFIEKALQHKMNYYLGRPFPMPDGYVTYLHLDLMPK